MMAIDIICGQLSEALTHDTRSNPKEQNPWPLFPMVTEAVGIGYAGWTQHIFLKNKYFKEIF